MPRALPKTTNTTRPARVVTHLRTETYCPYRCNFAVATSTLWPPLCHTILKSSPKFRTLVFILWKRTNQLPLIYTYIPFSHFEYGFEFAKKVISRFRPQRGSWICAMGHCPGFDSVLGARAQNWVLRYVPQHKRHRNFIWKLAASPVGKVIDKSVHWRTALPKAHDYSSPNSSFVGEKAYNSVQGTIVPPEIWIRISRQNQGRI